MRSRKPDSFGRRGPSPSKIPPLLAIVPYDIETIRKWAFRNNFVDRLEMMSEQYQGVTNPNYNQPAYQSAANPYNSAAHGSFAHSPSTYSSYPNYSGYSGYGGFSSPFGYGYGSMMGDTMWQGFLGQTAESLGRLNNLLSMTGMLVDHMSNHGKLLYSKGVEMHSWYNSLKSWTEKHSEWMERLGLQVESSWRTSEDEETRRRRMMIRRARSLLLLGFAVVILYLMRRRRKQTRRERWESIFHSGGPHVSRFNSP